MLNAVADTVPIGEAVGRRAGALLWLAGRSETVHGIVVAEVIETRGAEILTGDAADLSALSNVERSVTIHAL